MMHDQYQLAAQLDQQLGDPALSSNLFSHATAMKLDEADAFPEAEVSRLHNLGLHQVYVPEQLGGRFVSAEAFVALGRVLARRNMSAAVSYSTMLWTMLVWIGGDHEQKQKIAKWVLETGEFPCLAYSEKTHGADLIANELTAESQADGSYQLNGEKWPINRATRSGFLVLLAKVKKDQSLRNHSLFIVNKRELDCRQYYHLPRVKTHGLRGCDISGIGFKNARMPESARIGQEGHGLELALKGFQITRTFCTALSLGVGDSALRLVTQFALERQLYNGRMSELPHTRETLANAYLSQLLAETVSVISARGLHLFPRQFSSWSSVAKVQCTYLVDFACQKLASLLGARYFMREEHCDGIFQKFLRDGAIVSVFDGSSIICLDSLATLLPGIAKNRALNAGKISDDEIRSLFDLQAVLPPFPFDSFELHGRGRDAVAECLPQLISVLQTESTERPQCVATKKIITHAQKLLQRLEQLEAEILSTEVVRGERNSPQQFAFAERYCAIHACICALGFWTYNRGRLNDFGNDGVWLLAILERGGVPDFHTGGLQTAHTELLFGQLLHQYKQSHMFSLIPWQLASDGQTEQIS
jgi:alkylation response protein AidB-like acyl-CoA dehydrogenase